MKTEHTPGALGYGSGSRHVYDRQSGSHIATIHDDPRFGATSETAIGNELVLRWNAHDDLVTALLALTDYLDLTKIPQHDRLLAMS